MTENSSEKGRFGFAGRLLKRYYNWRVANLDHSAEMTITPMVRPIVQPKISFSEDTLCCTFKNTGAGTALNVETRIYHERFEFDGPLPETTIPSGKEVKLNVAPTSGIADAVEKIEVLTKYQDTGEKWFYSRLIQDKLGYKRFEYERLEKLERKDDNTGSH